MLWLDAERFINLFRCTSLALGQSSDRPFCSDATLKNVGKCITRIYNITIHNKTVQTFMGCSVLLWIWLLLCYTVYRWYQYPFTNNQDSISETKHTYVFVNWNMWTNFRFYYKSFIKYVRGRLYYSGLIQVRFSLGHQLLANKHDKQKDKKLVQLFFSGVTNCITRVHVWFIVIT